MFKGTKGIRYQSEVFQPLTDKVITVISNILIWGAINIYKGKHY